MHLLTSGLDVGNGIGEAEGGIQEFACTCSEREPENKGQRAASVTTTRPWWKKTAEEKFGGDVAEVAGQGISSRGHEVATFASSRAGETAGEEREGAAMETKATGEK